MLPADQLPGGQPVWTVGPDTAGKRARPHLSAVQYARSGAAAAATFEPLLHVSARFDVIEDSRSGPWHRSGRAGLLVRRSRDHLLNTYPPNFKSDLVGEEGQGQVWDDGRHEYPTPLRGAKGAAEEWWAG